jgi:hypothetical protein
MTGGFKGLLELFGQFIGTTDFVSGKGDVFTSDALLHTVFLSERVITGSGTVFISDNLLHDVFLSERVITGSGTVFISHQVLYTSELTQGC